MYKADDWQEIGPNMYRLCIHGGWLVKHTEEVFQEARSNWGWDWRSSIAFVPDPDHQWKVD